MYAPRLSLRYEIRETDVQAALNAGGKMSHNIRNEQPTDYRVVEEITRLAFWNLYVPGCNEHYLVHIMRSHKDFIRELDFVIEIDHEVIGNIMYTRSWLIDEAGNELDIITFGPVSIAPRYQRRGYGSILINHSIRKALERGDNAIVIYGNPGNYVKFGFKSCRKYQVTNENNEYPTAMLVKELKNGVLENKKWVYRESDVYNVDDTEAEKFNRQFKRMEKRVTASQEEFYILANSRVSANFIQEVGTNQNSHKESGPIKNKP
jgi:putative acetyltransferase